MGYNQIPRDMREIEIKITKTPPSSDPLGNMVELRTTLHVYGAQPMHNVMKLSGYDFDNVGLYVNESIRHLVHQHYEYLRTVVSKSKLLVGDDHVEPLNADGKINLAALPNVPSSATEAVELQKQLSTTLREHAAGNWASLNINTNLSSIAAEEEITKLKEENKTMKQLLAEVNDILRAVSVGDVAFGRGFEKMTYKEILEDIADCKARYADQGQTLKRYVYVPHNPMYIGLIDGVEVFSAMAFDDRIIALEDLRKATKLFKDMMVGIDTGGNNNVK